jgi:hypothetical protein
MIRRSWKQIYEDELKVILWRDFPAVSIKIFIAVLAIPTFDLVFNIMSQFLAIYLTIIHHHIQTSSCFMY